MLGINQKKSMKTVSLVLALMFLFSLVGSHVTNGEPHMAEASGARLLEIWENQGEAKELEIGAAKEVISPTQAHIDDGEVYLGGYGVPFNRQATGILDDIWARALAMTDGNETVIIVSLDVTGISNRQIKHIRDAASDATGVAAENIVINSTHTHSGPDLQGIFGGCEEGYRSYLREKTVEAIVGAVDSMQPARLEVTLSQLPSDLLNNRRGWGFTNNDLYTLQARGLHTDEVITTVAVYGAHTTIVSGSNTEVSRDWPGGTVDKLEDIFGGVGIYLTYLVGDVSPRSDGSISDRHERAIAYGEVIAEYAAASLNGNHLEDEEVAQHLSKLQSEINLLESAIYTELPVWVHSKDVTVEVHNILFKMLIGLLDYDMCDEHIDGEYRIVTSIHYIRLGSDILIRTIPGEGLTRFGVLMDEQVDHLSYKFKPILNLTNDTLGYVVPEDEWKTGRNGDYEENMSMWEGLAPLILDAYQQIIEKALTLTIEATDGGSTEPGGNLTQHYGDEVWVTATPEKGYRFSNWSVDENIIASLEAEFCFTMPDNDVTLTANFAKVRYGHVLDGVNITVADAIAVLRHIVGLEVLDGDARERAKVSAEGESITIQDAILILRRVVELIDKFPVEK